MTPAELLTHRARAQAALAEVQRRLARQPGDEGLEAQAAQLAAEVTACTILLGLHRLAGTVTAGWN